MKKLFIQAGIIITSSLILLSSCSKETPAIVTPPTGPNYSPGLFVSDSGIYYMTVTNWTSIPNSGVFSSTINTPQAPAGSTPSTQVKVYVLEDNKEINVNQPVDIDGGRMWTTVDALYIKFVYRTGSGYPPTAMRIKIHVF
ncbi:MAG: hypothetical protein ABUT20_07490 [Bacteroidota bacterium]